jgi:hypothetical protein
MDRGQGPAPEQAPRHPSESRLAPGVGASDAAAAALAEAQRRGLAALAAMSRAGADGSLPRGGAERHAPVGVTSLASLAWMAGGNQPERGREAGELARALDWLVEHADLDPDSPSYGYVSAGGDTLSRMHGHGFATLALAEAHGVCALPERAARIQRALAAAVTLIERTQGPEGGWFYDPVTSVSHEGSVTIALVQALRSARNAGLRVDPAVIARAEGYVERSQAEDGAFRYQLGSETRTVALTGAALATLNMAGSYDGPVLDRGVEALWRALALRDVEPESWQAIEREQRWYERLYVTQALWQRRELGDFERWRAREWPKILAEQRPDGSWGDPLWGESYATAMACLTLAVPDGLLPIFHR